MRRLLCRSGFLLGILALIFAWPVYGTVEMEVELGFNGQYYPDSLTPLHILLTNHGPLIRGKLTISQEIRTPWRGTVEERVSEPIQLETSSRKIFHLNFFIRGYIYPLSVKLYDGEEVILQKEIDLRDRYSEERVVLAVSEGAFPAKLPTGERVTLMSPDLLPQDWSGYDGVRRLYLGRFAPSSLGERQKRALGYWVRSGGELVILSGGSWYFQESPFLEKLIPFSVREVEQLDLGGPGPQPVVRGEPQGDVLYTEQGIPILVRGLLGAGRVFFSTINPFSTSVKDEFWKQLASKTEFALDEDRLSISAEALGEIKLSYPSKLLLSGLFLLYCGGFGLLGCLSIRSKRLSFLIILWVGAISVLLSIHLNQPRFTKPLRTSEVGLVRDLGDAALLSTWYGLFPRRAVELKLRAPLEGGLITQPLPQDRGDHLYDVDYLLDEGEVEIALKLRWGVGRHFYMERFAQDLADFSIERGQEGLLARIANLGDHNLHDCVVIWEGKVYPIGDIEAHRTTVKRLDEESPVYGEEWHLSRGEEELIKHKLYNMVRRELSGKTILLGWSDSEDLPRLLWEERTAVKLVLVEEDAAHRLSRSHDFMIE